jgi:hypothetical protein
MSSRFIFPDEWLSEPTPQPLPEVDDHRVEGLVNRFIAGKQEALHLAPDAFYRQERADAVDGAPAIAQRLQTLRTATLEQARDDGERAALGPRLDLHIEDAAEFEHDNDGKIGGLADAHASAAIELARMDGIAPDSPEEAAAILGARSRILRTAIGQRLATGNDAQALEMFERVKDELAPRDRRDLDVPIQIAATDRAADAWIARETTRPGEPLSTRVRVDSDLSPFEKATVLTKIAARDSVRESARFATVKGLDDKLDAARRTIARAPADYRTGTLSAIAEAYDAAGDPDKAAGARRLALHEGLLLPFARAAPPGSSA